jgi:hypothetical protein
LDEYGPVQSQISPTLIAVPAGADPAAAAEVPVAEVPVAAVFPPELLQALASISAAAPTATVMILGQRFRFIGILPYPGCPRCRSVCDRLEICGGAAAEVAVD